MTLQYQVLGVFNHAGVRVLRLRFYGTTTAFDTALGYEMIGVSGLVANQDYTESIWLALSGGTLSGISKVFLWSPVFDHATVEVANSPTDVGVLTPSLVRYVTTQRTPSGGEPFSIQKFYLLFRPTAAGVNVDFTVDVGEPQVIVGSEVVQLEVGTSEVLTRVNQVVRQPGVTDWFVFGWLFSSPHTFMDFRYTYNSTFLAVI